MLPVLMYITQKSKNDRQLGKILPLPLTEARGTGLQNPFIRKGVVSLDGHDDVIQQLDFKQPSAFFHPLRHTSPNRRILPFPNYRITELEFNQHIAESPNPHISELSNYRINSSPNPPISELPNRRITKLSPPKFLIP